MRGNQINWDDVRAFLACARAGSFRAGATEIGLASSTVVRKVARLEDMIEAQLFVRGREGLLLTDQGIRLQKEASSLEATFASIGGCFGADCEEPHGVVRLMAADDLGLHWLMPRLVKLKREAPELTIELQRADGPPKSEIESDIALQFEEPSDPGAIRKRLGYLHLTPFVSEEYATAYGVPNSLADVRTHRIVDLKAGHIGSHPWADELHMRGLFSHIGLRTTSSMALYSAVLAGAGIGALPNFIQMRSPSLQHVDIGTGGRYAIWMACNPLSYRMPHVRIVADWLANCFDRTAFPWFGPRFVKPERIPRQAY